MKTKTKNLIPFKMRFVSRYREIIGSPKIFLALLIATATGQVLCLILSLLS